MGVVGRPTPAVTVLFRVVRVRDDLVALGVLLLSQQLLEADDTGEDEGELADDESLQGQQGEGSKGQGDEGGGLQLEQKEQRKEDLGGLLLLTTSCNRKKYWG